MNVPIPFSGVAARIGTPLTEGERVDEPGLWRLTRYRLGGGLHAIFANGSMGTLAAHRLLSLLKRCAEASAWAATSARTAGEAAGAPRARHGALPPVG